MKQDKNPFVSNKIYQHSDRVGEFLQLGDTRPVTMELDMTNRCTDKCPCCAGGRERQNAEMPRERALELLDEFLRLGVRAVTFTGGGEPLCNAYTPEIMMAAARKGLDVALITNGVLLDSPDALKALPCCTWVRVSLDASDQEMYKLTHGTENMARVCRNIEKAAAALKGKDTTLGVGYLVSMETIRGMEAAASLCSHMGVDYIQFRPFHSATSDSALPHRAFDAFRHSQEYTSDTYKVLWSDHKFKAMLEHPGNPDRPYAACYGHSFAGVVGADGGVYLCCHLRGLDKYCFGNVNDTSLADIWVGAQRKSVVSHIDFKDCVPVCRCDAFNRILWDLRHNEPQHKNFL